jgi:flagellar biosynthesis/type III secretory pathway protein FliH
MPYVTSVEQIGYDRGLKEGRKEGRKEARSLLLLFLEQKLGQLSQPVLDRIHELSPKRLRALAIAVASLESVEDVVTWLESQDQE